jgi:hypothetical protein
MICVADKCRQARLECTRAECGYADARLHRVMHIPLKREEADAPVSTTEQTMTWSALVWALSCGVVAAVFITLAVNWPLFLAAVK